jgi:hypothetical protein
MCSCFRFADSLIGPGGLQLLVSHLFAGSICGWSSLWKQGIVVSGSIESQSIIFCRWSEGKNKSSKCALRKMVPVLQLGVFLYNDVLLWAGIVSKSSSDSCEFCSSWLFPNFLGFRVEMDPWSWNSFCQRWLEIVTAGGRGRRKGIAGIVGRFESIRRSKLQARIAPGDKTRVLDVIRVSISSAMLVFHRLKSVEHQYESIEGGEGRRAPQEGGWTGSRRRWKTCK